jgi:zinc protease
LGAGDALLLRRGRHSRVWAYQMPLLNPSSCSIARRKLDNGITLLLQPRDTSAAVSVAGLVPFGTFLDQDSGLGLTNLTSSMLRRGTLSRTFQEMNNALDGVGASLSFAAGRDELSISGRCLVDDLDLVVDLLGEMLCEPSFPALELARLQGQLLTQMAELDRDPSYRAHLAFVESIYGSDHPYGRPLLGRAESVAALTGEDLLALYRTHLHPRGTILALAGGLDPDVATERLNATLGTWQPASTPPMWTSPPAMLPVERITRTIDIPARPQLDLMYGVLGMPRHAEDYYAGVVANVILGELGMMGRLGASIRDDLGLAYDIGSDLFANRAERPWVVPEELDDAKSLLIGSLPLYLETNEGIASYLLSIESYDLGLDYVQRYPEIIRRVTADGVREVIRRYWPHRRAVVTAAGTL